MSVDELNGIAIIGMNGRFPKASNIEEFWRRVRDGVDSISYFTDEELLAAGVERSTLDNPNYVKARGVVDNVDLFDASFFNLTRKEAEVTDPQQRIFLECAWEAMEAAGYSCDSTDQLVGVYAGAGYNSYLTNLWAHEDYVGSLGFYKLSIGNEKDHLTMRVAYALDLRGPSFTVQSTCSTSLVAIHLACQGLLDYQCDIALAGGSTLCAQQRLGYFYSEGISSPDGRCRPFDAHANGLVNSNGVAVVVLKRLQDAVADGDTIYAVIKGSAINSDGHSKVGYSAPSLDGQASVIAMAQAAAEVEPETISYVETHGTATPLGDMIEVGALTKVFRASTDKRSFCAIGSLKSNMGHLDTAAGVASVIKIALALKHKQVPPSANFEKPNPRIDFGSSPFYVNARLAEWKSNGGPRRAGVSAFAHGGTNGHLIMEEAPEIEPSGPSRQSQLLILSAKTELALEKATDNLANHLSQGEELNLADAAYTLHVGRKTFKYRRVLVCENREDAATALKMGDPKRLLSSMQEAVDRPVALMFSGAGEQYLNMGLELYRSEPTFREQIDLCSGLLKPQLGLELKDVIYPNRNAATVNSSAEPGQRASQQAGLDLRRMLRPSEPADEATQKLNQTLYAQPALFIVEYALAQLWREWGITPQAMIGYSVGEYVAACLAGVFSLEDALSLVAKRAQMIQELPGGAMLTVPLPARDVAPLLGGELSLAATAGPSLSVVAGPAAAVCELEQRLNGTVCRRVPTSHAFHSTMLEPIASRFADEIRGISLSAPQIPFVSNVTGTWITDAEAVDPVYWANHMCQTVRFTEGIATLRKRRDLVLLEAGPGQSLVTWVIQHPTSDNIPDTVALPSLRHSYDPRSDTSVLLQTLGKLWLAGVKVDWRGFHRHEKRHRVVLPTYPFERERYWLEPQRPASSTQPRRSLERRSDLADWFYLPVWKQCLSPEVSALTGKPGQLLSWLVFLDSRGVGQKIVERLREQGHDVAVIEQGDQFTKLNDRAYYINPREARDYLELLADLKGRGVALDRIVHLWSVTDDEPPLRGRELFSQMQAVGFYSLLFLTQALIKHDLARPQAQPGAGLQLQLISNNVHQVTGDERLCPEKATILGACKSIPQEYPGISCLSIDLSLPRAGTWQEARLIENLVEDLKTGPANTTLAYRGSTRWTQTFDPIRREAEAGVPSRLRQRGVYLMTGGLGKDSLMRARYLAEALQARLVLIGRSRLPERADWEEWLAAHNEQDEVSLKIKAVKELEDLGAEVLVVRADVGVEEEMRSVIEQTDQRFGELHGVIHAAGVTNVEASRLISELQTPDCELQFHPKVYGLYVLEKVLQGRRLDFCILTSSAASIIGGVGLMAYTSSNIFMDVFAYRHNQEDPVSWMSLNWQGTSPENTVEAFKRIVSMPPTSQVVISAQDLQARIDQRIKLEFLREAERPQSRISVRPNLRNVRVGPSTETEQKILDIWSDLLGADWLGIHDSFMEVGGDSLLAVQLISRMNQTFGVTLPLRGLFETPTIAGLAEQIDQTLDPSQLMPAGVEAGSAGADQAGQERDDALASLVGIQTGGTKPSFFCVHPSGGNVFCFVQLARLLGADQPFYAFQSKGLNPGHAPQTTVEEMAAYYVEVLRHAQPTGPYLLGGWSMGGLVAFEMAQQLRAQGEEIPLLALLDTKADYRSSKAASNNGGAVSNLMDFAGELASSWGLEVSWSDLDIDWTRLSQLMPDDQLAYLLKSARDIGAIPIDAELLKGEQLLKVFSANADAMHRYVSKAYPGRVTLIRTADQPGEPPRTAAMGWEDLAAQGVAVYTVGGSHYSMVREPFVTDLAKVLSGCLEEATVQR